LTPHAAARLGMADELQRMIAANPGVVHERGGDGQYPLHFSSSPEIVDILADAGADMDARCIDHESTAAQWRAKEFDVLEALIRRGAATDIFTAVAVDEPKLVEKHLSEDPDSLLRKAAEPGNPMIHHAAPGAPIYVYVLGNLRPLQVAANLDRKKAFQFLFEKSPGPVQLMAACWMGDRSTAESLSKYLPELSAEDLSQVSDAAKARRHDLVRLMLELGFPVDAQDNEGMSPVHWAGFHGDLEGLRTILSFQPDLTLKNGYGGDALSTTCYGSANCWYPDGKYADSVRLLLDSGAPFRSDIHGTDEVNAVLKEYANR
ncbi:MAG TPA: ankyrin repeat domain-containing protein, partial [Fimbriimonadaceae bacterium]|nr:ankyrin repeat domain-containing protein [Fimbriimonadaceae bacterium]